MSSVTLPTHLLDSSPAESNRVPNEQDSVICQRGTMQAKVGRQAGASLAKADGPSSLHSAPHDRSREFIDKRQHASMDRVVSSTANGRMWNSTFFHERQWKRSSQRFA